MNAADLLAQLDGIGAKLVAKPPDWKLVIVARKGIVTPELAALVSAHKEELRQMLKAGAVGEKEPPPAAALSSPHNDEPIDEVEQWKRAFPTITLEPRPSVPPTPLGPVRLVLGGEWVTFTLVRHGCTGPNRDGQDPKEFPLALINLPAWCRERFDLRLAPWYRSREEAVAGGMKPVKLDEQRSAEAEERPTSALFPQGRRVTLRRESNRWVVWVERYGKQERRKDFASPFRAHAQLAAEYF